MIKRSAIIFLVAIAACVSAMAQETTQMKTNRQTGSLVGGAERLDDYAMTEDNVTTWRGRVVDADTGELLPYAYVKTMQHKYGTLATEKGEFELKLPQGVLGDSIEVSYVGFKPIAIPVLANSVTDNLVVQLYPVAFPLQEIKVMPTKKIRHITIGKKHSYGMFKTYIGGTNFSTKGESYGLEVKDKKHTTWLKSVGFYIIKRDDMLKRMKIRINIYDMKNVKDAPTNKFVNVHKPIYFEYRQENIVKNKYTYTLPNPIQLPAEAMVEIELLEDMGQECVYYKSNLIGKGAWFRDFKEQNWDKPPFSVPFFLECVQER